MTTPTTLTITEWLLTRIAEDEMAAASLTTYGSYGPPDFPMRARRELATCKAHRRIVELHGSEPNDTRCQSWNGNWSYEPCETLRALAAIYADRPDYREEWKP